MRFINPKKLWTFARVPNWLMKRKDVSPGAKLCYGRLSQFCDDLGRASPSREDLADELAVTPASIDRYLSELINCGVLVSKRRGQGRSNVYFFPEVPEIAPMESEPEMPIVNQESADMITQESDNELSDMMTLDLSPSERSPKNQESADMITPLILEEKKKRKNKDKKITKSSFLLPDWLDKNLWADFKEMRKKLRRPMTLKAEELIVRKLDKLRAAGDDPREVLEQSIERSWQGVFPVRVDYRRSGETELTDGERLTARLAQTARRGL